MRTAYAPDFLVPITFSGDPLLNGISKRPTVMTTADAAQGAGSNRVMDALNSLGRGYANANGSADAGTSDPATAVAPAPDDCSQYTVGSWDWSQCQGKRFDSAVSKPINDLLSRGLFGVLGVALFILGAWLLFKD